MPDWVLQLLGIIGSCAAVYAGVKVDLARAIAKAEEAEHCAREAQVTAVRAHDRIDDILNSGRKTV